MADRPIPFSGPMIRALLDGRKTQTRRVLKPQPAPANGWDWCWPIPGKSVTPGTRQCWRDDTAPGIERYMPYAVGDRLWVREAWRTLQKFDDLKPRHLADDIGKITYEADPERRNPLWAFGRYRHARFMPRWANRLTLLVTEVRVQRLQEISEEDAISEGVQVTPRQVGCPEGGPAWEAYPREDFKELWRSINPDEIPVLDEDGRTIGMEPNPARWDANPWVAAVTFSVHRCNIDRMETAPRAIQERSHGR